jgi:hypothetical protein
VDFKRNLYKEERQGIAAKKKKKSSRIVSQRKGKKRKTLGEMRNELECMLEI